MKFNKYVWELYKTSELGKKKIEECKPFEDVPHAEEFLFAFDPKEYDLIIKLGLQDYVSEGRVNLVKVYFHYFKNKHFSPDDAEKIFSEWVEEGVSFGGFEFIGKEEYAVWSGEIEKLSNALYVAFPDFFFPYFFLHSFDEFQTICSSYEIFLPEIPQKRHKKKRIEYYVEICRVLYEFRVGNNMTPEELIAFIYDFVPKSIQEEETSEPVFQEPSKVWYVGAGPANNDFLDNARQDDTSYWQCNIDTRPGDIIIMYCWSPRSYIHSVWRATTNGFIDPFFYYYTLAYISEPIKVPQISFKEIKNNQILSQSPIVANNFQGVNGYPVTSAEYEEMIRLWQMKGMAVQVLPRFKVIKALAEDIILKDERDVEIYLIEPLLKKLRYKETDWIRQMPVKMGRGLRYYPDYCFGAISKRGEESAKMLIESKYVVKNTKNLKDAYYQAKSYAVRLQAEKFAIASKEGIWVHCQINGHFKSEKYTYFEWNDLENPDELHKISKLIGKDAKG